MHSIFALTSEWVFAKKVADKEKITSLLLPKRRCAFCLIGREPQPGSSTFHNFEKSLASSQVKHKTTFPDRGRAATTSSFCFFFSAWVPRVCRPRVFIHSPNTREASTPPCRSYDRFFGGTAVAAFSQDEAGDFNVGGEEDTSSCQSPATPTAGRFVKSSRLLGASQRLPFHKKREKTDPLNFYYCVLQMAIGPSDK